MLVLDSLNLTNVIAVNNAIAKSIRPFLYSPQGILELSSKYPANMHETINM
jgi:hypothetical protein